MNIKTPERQERKRRGEREERKEKEGRVLQENRRVGRE
jgi:hypothetical protein